MDGRPRPVAYAFIAFPMAILVVFTLGPTVAGLVLSLFSWDGATPPRFVGLGNFRALAQDRDFWPALTNTLVFAMLTVPPAVVGGFLLAVAADARWFRGRTLVRACLFLPSIVSIVAVGVVWRGLLDTGAGPIPVAADTILAPAGLASPAFLEGRWALVSIAGVQVWRTVGFCFVLYLAALAAVNRSLYEAAAVDGASPWSVVRHVTWPQVSPMTAFLAVTGVIGALQVFDIVWAMTQQAESDATRVLNLSVYREFKASRYGHAAAIGVVIFGLTLAATAAQLWVARRRSAA